MAITDQIGNIFTTQAQAIGHGVNTKGVMGAGIAFSVRLMYPEIYLEYRELCDSDGLQPGGVYTALDDRSGRYIVNLASQDAPGANARLEWLRSSLSHGLDELNELGVTSLALPRIGAGIGGLEWPEVREAIEEVAEAYPHMELELWEFKPKAG